MEARRIGPPEHPYTRGAFVVTNPTVARFVVPIGRSESIARSRQSTPERVLSDLEGHKWVHRYLMRGIY
jgi:hypothetical protein